VNRRPPFADVDEDDDEARNHENPSQNHAADVPEEPSVKATDLLIHPNVLEVPADDDAD
jgi:hypothetical protein